MCRIRFFRIQILVTSTVSDPTAVQHRVNCLLLRWWRRSGWRSWRVRAPSPSGSASSRRWRAGYYRSASPAFLTSCKQCSGDGVRAEGAVIKFLRITAPAQYSYIFFIKDLNRNIIEKKSWLYQVRKYSGLRINVFTASRSQSRKKYLRLSNTGCKFPRNFLTVMIIIHKPVGPLRIGIQQLLVWASICIRYLMPYNICVISATHFTKVFLHMLMWTKN